MTQCGRPCSTPSQGSSYVLCCSVSFPFPSFPPFGENEKLLISFKCVHKPEESMDGVCSVSASWGAPARNTFLWDAASGTGWGGGGPLLNPVGSLRALMGLNVPSQPHLGPPPPPSSQEPYFSSALDLQPSSELWHRVVVSWMDYGPTLDVASLLAGLLRCLFPVPSLSLGWTLHPHCSLVSRPASARVSLCT